MSSDNKSERKAESDKIKLVFQEGETVLCYHGPLLYEAKCIKAELKNKTPQYLIHYSGWNKSWDEWVNCPRVCKFSEENLKKQQELLKSHGTSKIITKIKASARKSITSIANLVAAENEKLNSSDTRKKRPKVEETSELSDSYTIKNEIKITIPDKLKKSLANEYHTITTLNKLVNLPSRNSVEMVLNEYIEYKLEQNFDRDVIIEAIEGLKYYFNSVLSTKLLINNSERQQYSDLLKNSDKKPSEVYGCEHFLRLFVIIGDLLSYSYWDEVCIKQLDLYLEDVMKYLNLKSNSLFIPNNYTSVPSNYTQKTNNEKK